MRRANLAFLAAYVAAAAILVLARHEPPLSAVLFASPILAACCIPMDWWRWKHAWWMAAVAALLSGHQAIVLALIETRDFGCQVVWVPALEKTVALLGVGFCLLGLSIRWWRRWAHRPIVRRVGCVLILTCHVGIFGPMPLVYRNQITYGHDDYSDCKRWRQPSCDGIVLDTLYIPASGESKGVVLFTHGVGRWKEFYQGHLLFFRDHGWSVLCYDLRGHGRSTLAPMTYGTRESDDLVVEWEQAKALAGGKPVVAYGVSLGGAITLQAGHRLDGCSGMIIESAFADLESMVGIFLKPPGRWFALAMCKVGLEWSPTEVRPVDAPILKSGPPLLLGWTTVDQVVPPEQSRRLAEASPRAETIISPTAHHTGMIREAQWRTGLAAFLDRLAAHAPSP